MAIMCNYQLWVLGDGVDSVRSQLEAAGWHHQATTEIGARFTARGRNLLMDAPNFSERTDWVVVMSADHDQGMELNLLLQVDRGGCRTSEYWRRHQEEDVEGGWTDPIVCLLYTSPSPRD